MNLFRRVREDDWRLAVHVFAVFFLLTEMALFVVGIFWPDSVLLTYLGH